MYLSHQLRSTPNAATRQDTKSVCPTRPEDLLIHRGRKGVLNLAIEKSNPGRKETGDSYCAGRPRGDGCIAPLGPLVVLHPTLPRRRCAAYVFLHEAQAEPQLSPPSQVRDVPVQL